MSEVKKELFNPKEVMYYSIVFDNDEIVKIVNNILFSDETKDGIFRKKDDVMLFDTYFDENSDKLSEEDKQKALDAKKEARG